MCGSYTRRIHPWRSCARSRGSRSRRVRHLRRVFWDSDPRGEIGYAHQPAGKEESQNSDDANRRYIPTIAARKGHADTGNLAANARPDQRPAGRSLGRGYNCSAVGTEARTRWQSSSAAGTVDGHRGTSSGQSSHLQHTRIGRHRFPPRRGAYAAPHPRRPAFCSYIASSACPISVFSDSRGKCSAKPIDASRRSFIAPALLPTV